jgi:hypothetical protein
MSDLQQHLYLSVRSVSAHNRLCKDVDIFRKPITSLKADSAPIRDILFKSIYNLSEFKAFVKVLNLDCCFLNTVIFVVLLGFIFAFLFLFCV